MRGSGYVSVNNLEGETTRLLYDYHRYHVYLLMDSLFQPSVIFLNFQFKEGGGAQPFLVTFSRDEKYKDYTQELCYFCLILYVVYDNF